VLWRLRCQSSGQITECLLIDHWPISFELRLIHTPQGLTTASTRFADTDSAINAAAVIGGALRADGWTDIV
jgi:hypothetical protein